MRDIFTDLYKKVLGFFQANEEDKTESGGTNEVAKNRLKLVLMQDRTNLTPYLLERMRGEMIQVLSKYVEMDQEELELNFEQEGDSMALMLSIPVLRAKEEEEINAIIKAEEEAQAEKVLVDENSKAESTEETEEESVEENSDSEEEDEDEKDSQNDEKEVSENTDSETDNEETEKIIEGEDSEDEKEEETEEEENPSKKNKKRK